MTEESLFSRGIFYRYAHFLGRYLVDSFTILFTRANRTNAFIIIRPDGIGDFIVWLDSARVLREHYAGRRCILIANQLFADLAEQVDYFDEVIAVNPKAFESDLSYRFRTVRQIRKIGAEIAIQPVLSRRFWTGDAMIRVSSAQECIGAEGDLSNMRPWQHRLARRWYTRRITVDDDATTEFERNADFLLKMGIDQSHPSIGSIGSVSEGGHAIRPEGTYFVVFPGAGSPKRFWPAGRFAEVASFVAEKTGWRLVVCGSPADAEVAQTIIESAGTKGAQSLAGQTSIPELAEVIRGARLLIGNETSAVHIAAAVSTPSVCLLGGGHFGRFAPYPDSIDCDAPITVYRKMDCFGCNWQCTQPHEAGQAAPCIERISVGDVLNAVKPLLLKEELDRATPSH